MKLWSNNFQWICESNFWIYNSLYALLAGLPFMLAGIVSHENLVRITLCFVVGIWIPGPFTAYLMDRFKRKSIYIGALLGCLLMTLPIPYSATHPEWLCLLRLVQGICYGLALNLGNTLTIDISPSPRRSEANGAFARTGRIGIWTGIAGAAITWLLMGGEGIYFFSLGTGVLALLCVFMVSVTFRAPMDLPKFSLDRYFLPRSWPETINLFFLALIPGILISSCLFIAIKFYHTSTSLWIPWIAFIAGSLGAFYSRHSWLKKQSSQLHIGIGLTLLVVGSALLCGNNTTQTFPFALFLIGAGLELAASEFLYMFIRMSHHCQRSTANASYLFAWETGCALGSCIGLYNQEGEALLFTALITFILYFAFTAKHYKNRRKR